MQEYILLHSSSVIVYMNFKPYGETNKMSLVLFVGFSTPTVYRLNFGNFLEDCYLLLFYNIIKRSESCKYIPYRRKVHMIPNLFICPTF